MSARVRLHPMGALQRRPRGFDPVAWWVDCWWARWVALLRDTRG
jgi:hypothetical protein